MMKSFYIQKLTVSGKGKKDSIVEFTSGLNIVCGPSNTGKTYIVECIDFIFGGKTPIDEVSGFNRVRMDIITTNEEYIQVEREFGRNIIMVHSQAKGIESGSYGGKNAPKPSEFWLSLIGITGEPQIIVNERFEPKALTWRTFLHMFLIKEENIFQRNSIIRNAGFSVPTAPLSTLLFLLKNMDFKELEPIEKPEVRKARQKAKRDYINGKMTQLAEQHGALSDAMALFSNVDIEGEMQNLISHITEVERRIQEASKHSRTLLEHIYDVSAKLEESDFLQNRYTSLETQYLSDIKRLQFIVGGELHSSNYPQNTKCPFCENDLSEQEQSTYIEAAGAEIQSISAKLSDLRELKQEIAKEHAALETDLLELKNRNSDVMELIEHELRPYAEELKRKLQDYRTVIQIQREMDVLKHLSTGMDADLMEMESEETSELKYKPREYFGAEFIETMSKYLTDMLEQCKYDHLMSVRFSLESFDVVVNGKRKENEGKGYRAFLNTVFSFTLMKYLSLHGVYAPRLFIADSPILSLKERGNEQASDSMKSSLFRYLSDHCDCGQVIIIENTIPELDYSKVNVIRFTMDDEHGRYGFLEGVHN